MEFVPKVFMEFVNYNCPKVPSIKWSTAIDMMTGLSVRTDRWVQRLACQAEALGSEASGSRPRCSRAQRRNRALRHSEAQTEGRAEQKRRPRDMRASVLNQGRIGEL